MSLGQEIAPHLPFMRRFARALLGSQSQGDAAVRRVLETIISAPSSVRSDGDLRVALYTLLLNSIINPPESSKERPESDAEASNGVDEGERDENLQAGADETDDASSGSSEPLEEIQRFDITQRRMQLIPTPARQALLLTGLEGFSSDETARIIGADEATVDSLVASALEEIERQTHSQVLIMEDEPIIGLDLKAIVEDLGHEVVGIARTKAEALRLATDSVGLVLADIQLEDGYTGVEAVEEIVARRQRPVIFITAFPDKLLDAPHSGAKFLITKPFQRSTVKAAIAQALFFEASTTPPEVQREPSAELVKDREPAGARGGKAHALISAPQLQPRLSPIDATVDGGKLRLVRDPMARTGLPRGSIEAVRRVHEATAARICAELQATNVGPGPVHRLAAIVDTLSEPITRSSSIRLGVQSRGLQRLLEQVAEVVDDVRLTDLRVLVDDLLELARQFDEYRTFVDEARIYEGVADDSAASAGRLAEELAKQPDEVIEPALKHALTEVGRLAAEVDDPLARFALFRSLGNILRAVARWLMEHMKAITAEARNTFDKGMGKVLGFGLLAMFVGTPVVLLSTNLISLHPHEFSFLVEVLRVAKELVG